MEYILFPLWSISHQMPEQVSQACKYCDFTIYILKSIQTSESIINVGNWNSPPFFSISLFLFFFLSFFRSGSCWIKSKTKFKCFLFSISPLPPLILPLKWTYGMRKFIFKKKNIKRNKNLWQYEFLNRKWSRHTHTT